MGWRFWRDKAPTQVQTVEADASEVAAPSPVDAPVESSGLSASGFSFESPAEGQTLESPASPPRPTRPGVAAVVRDKRDRARTIQAKVADRGVRPVMVPSLRERALLYRAAAVAQTDTDPMEATNLWHAYLALDGRDVDGWFQYGALLLSQGMHHEAWGAFSEAQAVDPEHALAAGALGFMSLRRGDGPAALAAYETASRLRPGCLDMLRGLGDAQAACGLTEAAATTRATLLEELG